MNTWHLDMFRVCQGDETRTSRTRGSSHTRTKMDIVVAAMTQLAFDEVV